MAEIPCCGSTYYFVWWKNSLYIAFYIALIFVYPMILTTPWDFKVARNNLSFHQIIVQTANKTATLSIGAFGSCTEDSAGLDCYDYKYNLTKIPMSVNTDVCQHIKPETLKDLLAPSTVLQQAVAIVNGVFMGVCLIGNILVGFHGNLERLKIVSLILFVLSVIGVCAWVVTYMWYFKAVHDFEFVFGLLSPSSKVTYHHKGWSGMLAITIIFAFSQLLIVIAGILQNPRSGGRADPEMRQQNPATATVPVTQDTPPQGTPKDSAPNDPQDPAPATTGTTSGT